ncbi:MAG: hypothetical protein KY476_26520, partial [Planctomycetes bacterium]|nr:hypothetical protein [Planctomycetota bacterium]
MSLRRNMLTYASADLAAMAVSLLVSPIMTRLLTPQQYGVVPLLNAVWAFLSVMRYGSMDFALPLFLARPGGDPETHRWSVLQSATRIATLSAVSLSAAFAVACLAG